MARCRVVIPETVRVDISDGDWVDFKKRLSHGEKQKMFASLLKDLRPNGEASLDRAMVGTAQLMAYLADWSLLDPKGKQIDISTDARKKAAIDSLTEETVAEMLQALDGHLEATEVEADAAKKSQGTASASLAT